jgi:hypothetical protein
LCESVPRSSTQNQSGVAPARPQCFLFAPEFTQFGVEPRHPRKYAPTENMLSAHQSMPGLRLDSL